MLRDEIGKYLLLPLKHYSLLWTSASNKIFLHSCRSLATVYKILIPVAFKSSSISSIQLFRSLPILLFPSILAVTNCFHIPSSLILVICPYHLNPLNPELNPICYLLALLAHHFLHVSRIRVKSLNIRLLMSYIYIYIYIWSAYS